MIYLYNMFFGLQTNKGKLYYKMLVKYSLTFAAKKDNRHTKSLNDSYHVDDLVYL